MKTNVNSQNLNMKASHRSEDCNFYLEICKYELLAFPGCLLYANVAGLSRQQKQKVSKPRETPSLSLNLRVCRSQPSHHVFPSKYELFVR